MKEEIVDETNYAAIDIEEHFLEQAWKVLDNGFTVEIFWEALNLIELYITLRIMEHVLLIVEYTLLEVKINPSYLIEQELVQSMNMIGDFFEEGKSRIWEIFNVYHISETMTSVRGQITMDSKKDGGECEDFISRYDRRSTHSLAPYITEALTSSYCC